MDKPFKPSGGCRSINIMCWIATAEIAMALVVIGLIAWIMCRA